MPTKTVRKPGRPELLPEGVYALVAESGQVVSYKARWREEDAEGVADSGGVCRYGSSGRQASYLALEASERGFPSDPGSYCDHLAMPSGDTQRQFAEAAARDGIELVPQSVDWLNQRGHLGLPDDDERRPAFEALERIYLALGGDLEVLDEGRMSALPGDFTHEPTGTLIEVDESQHFTSFRLATLDLYPDDVALGFDLATYKQLCKKWQKRSDGYYRTKAARGFGVGGRQKQRAYYDALRDLATPAMGRPPLIRIEAAERDPADAYRRHRDELLAALG